MHELKRADNLFVENNPNSEPLAQLVFDNQYGAEQNLFGDVPDEPATVLKLFPDGDYSYRQLDLQTDPSQPVIQLLPDNPSEEAVLRLRVQLLEVKLARQNAQINFAERIDVDHLEWKRQKIRIQNLQAGNFLLIMLTCALLFGAGCMVVIK